MSSARAAIQALLIGLVVASGATACRHDDHTSTSTTSVEHVLGGKRLTTNVAAWNDTRAFYAERMNAPAWINERSATKLEAVLDVLRSAPAHGLNTTDYDVAGLTEALAALNEKSHAPDRSERMAILDVRLTAALLTLGRDVALGRTSPSAIDPRWKARRTAPDFVGALRAVSEADPHKWLDAVRPPHREYAALEAGLADLRRQKEQGGWRAVPTGTFKRAQSHPSVAILRERLTTSGELRAQADAGVANAFDVDVEAAVRSFQDHQGIKATGIVDKSTLAALNVSIDDRIRQVEINLERWRWMPADFGARHILVNIPAFLLTAREDGRTVMDVRVVVGKLGNETPVFSGNMAHVVFSPYWNLPESIVKNETAPAAARDASYLDRNDIEVLRVSKSGTTSVDPAHIDWDNPSEVRQLTFRQRPGPKNALGHVKFLFPNPFDVYLHDSPATALYGRAARAFSHGCVRVEEPEALAKYVLREHAEWDESRIQDAMASGVEKYVVLGQTIPVHITYFTAWVDDGGGLHFQPDVYGYDAKQLRLATTFD